MTEVKVTYLLGAGASHHAHSLKSADGKEAGFQVALNIFLEQLKKDPHFTTANQKYVKEIFSSVEGLAKEIPAHVTPDTIAKLCSLTNELAKLKSLKNTLSIYFIISELLFKWTDPRYINFLAGLLNNGEDFRHDVKILTWNYDFQLELAASRIHDDNGKGSSLLKYLPGYGLDHRGIPPGTNPVGKPVIDVVHLNGIAYVSSSESVYHMERRHSLKDYMRFWQSMDEGGNNFVKFAWEQDDPLMLLDPVYDHLKGTTVLIIIGYSFPLFNRKIDTAIFEAIRNGGKLSEAYFQNPSLKGDILTSLFEVPSGKIRDVQYYDRFFVPYYLP